MLGILVRKNGQVLNNPKRSSDIILTLHQEDEYNNAYAVFALYVNPSTHLGLLISLLNGKFLSSVNDQYVLSSLSYNVEVYDKDGQIWVRFNGELLRYIHIPQTNRVWWNFNAMDKFILGLTKGDMKDTLTVYRNAIWDTFKGKLTYLNYTVESGFYIQRPLTELELHSALNILISGESIMRTDEGDKVVWSRCSSRSTPKVILLYGSTGVGKSYLGSSLAKEQNLQNPIRISYDDPLNYIPDYGLLHTIRLGTYGIALSDALPHIYELSGTIEEELQSIALRNKLDIIMEKSDWNSKSVDYILGVLKTEGYHIEAVYKTTDSLTRHNNMQNRFNLSGRYGSFYTLDNYLPDIQDYFRVRNIPFSRYE